MQETLPHGVRGGGVRGGGERFNERQRGCPPALDASEFDPPFDRERENGPPLRRMSPSDRLDCLRCPGGTIARRCGGRTARRRSFREADVAATVALTYGAGPSYSPRGPSGVRPPASHPSSIGPPVQKVQPSMCTDPENRPPHPDGGDGSERRLTSTAPPPVGTVSSSRSASFSTFDAPHFEQIQPTG